MFSFETLGPIIVHSQILAVETLGTMFFRNTTKHCMILPLAGLYSPSMMYSLLIIDA